MVCDVMKKLVFDIVASSLGSVVLAVPMAALWGATRVYMGKGVIFKQEYPDVTKDNEARAEL